MTARAVYTPQKRTDCDPPMELMNRSAISSAIVKWGADASAAGRNGKPNGLRHQQEEEEYIRQKDLST